MDAANRLSQMRILHVIDSAGIYGAEKVLITLAVETTRQEHEVYVGTIVSPHDASDALGDAVIAKGMRHVRFQMRDGLNLPGLQQIIRFARDQRIDVIHSHGYKANILLACVPRRLRSWGQVCTLHGWTSATRFQKLRLYEMLERRMVRRFDYVIAVSDKIAEHTRHRSFADRLVVIPNGVDTAGKLSRPTLEQRQSDELPRLLAVGRLGPEKGFDLLIEAMQRLRISGIGATLVIVGHGSERPRLAAQIAAHDLGDYVQLVGYQSNVEPFYSDADIFVLSSRTEGLPIVLLEAMVHGVAVVATAVGEVPKVLEDGRCGWLIAVPTVEGVARVLAEAIQASGVERRSRAQRARDRVLEGFSAASMALRYLDVYARAAQHATVRLRTGRHL